MSNVTKKNPVVDKPTDKPKVKNPYVSFSKAETEALRAVCLRSFRLYFELKWLANFKTGMLGTFGKQKITYEYLAERVAIPTSQGRSTTNSIVDGKEVSRLIQRLEIAGLVADVNRSDRGLTMYLPLSPLRAKPDDQTVNEEEDDDDWLTDDDKTPAVSGNINGKLPTSTATKSAPKPDEIREICKVDPPLSVLTNTNPQYLFSVPETPDLRSGLRRPEGTAFIEGLTPATLNLNAGQILDFLSRKYQQFHYLNTPVSAKFFDRIAGLGVNAVELDEIALAMVNDPIATLTAGELFAKIVSNRKRSRVRLGSRVAL